ncbi:MAG: hypothetical protein ACYDIA_24585 [Candidatus Humimicrobiaceae bacterium]
MNTLTLDIQKEKRTFDYNNNADFINTLTSNDEDKTDIFNQSNTEVSNIWVLNNNIDSKLIKSYLFNSKKWINTSALNNLFDLRYFNNRTFKNVISSRERFLSYDAIKNINYEFILNSYFALHTTEQKLSSYISYFKILSLYNTDRNLNEHFEIFNNPDIDDFLKKYHINNNELIEIGKQIKYFYKEQIDKIYLIYRKDYEEDFENLFIKIKTTIDFEKSLEILNNFFIKYWFKKPQKIKNIINIFLSFD